MPFRKLTQGGFLAPECKNCRSTVHHQPFRIEARTINGAKFVSRWEFCSPSCLTEFTTSDEWINEVQTYEESR
jgi:hypothetical protein